MAAKVGTLKTEVKYESRDDDEEMETADLEEGEISEDDEAAPLAEIEAGLFENIDESNKEEGAKRFKLIGDLSLAVPKQELDELYESLGIDQENERHFRFNTVHLRGAEGMGTKDVIDYFSGLEPVAVDWLEKGICNIQWDDEILPARALLYLSIEIKNFEKRLKKETGVIDSDSDEEMEVTGNAVDACKLKFPLPPGRWRKGNTSELSKDIIMRYANKDDKRHHRRHGKSVKKTKHKEVHVEDEPKDPWGSLAQTWGRGEGVEDHIWPSAPPRNIPDLRSSLNDVIESRFADVYLRRAAELRREMPPPPPVFLESSSDSAESEDHSPRRRKLPKMRADIEEEKQKLARLEKVAKSGDLRSRLNHKKPSARTMAAQSQSDESGDDLDTEWASEHYQDMKRTLVNNTREDSLESGSDLELGDDEPGELLEIQVDNEYYQDKRRRRRH